VEGRGAHAVDTERAQSRAELAGSLVGERHRHDLSGLEGAARDLPRDPTRDRRRLPRPRPGEDAYRTARSRNGSALLGVQPSEDSVGFQVAEASDATGRARSRKGQVFVSTRGSISST
jgi:hypothetical protein